MNLIYTIQREMQNDDCDDLDQSARLEALYEAASPEGKKLIDDALICICGWSMDSLRGLA